MELVVASLWHAGGPLTSAIVVPITTFVLLLQKCGQLPSLLLSRRIFDLKADGSVSFACL